MALKVQPDEIAKLIAQAHPRWTDDAVRGHAQAYAETLDARLLDLLRVHIDTGDTPNFRQGEFSVAQIQRLVRGRSYLDALVLMDAYLKDEASGRARILRR